MFNRKRKYKRLSRQFVALNQKLSAARQTGASLLVVEALEELATLSLSAKALGPAGLRLANEMEKVLLAIAAELSHAPNDLSQWQNTLVGEIIRREMRKYTGSDPAMLASR